MGSGQARAAAAVEVVKDGKLVKSGTVKVKEAKIEERVWYHTTPERYTRMKRKERFVHSVKSVVDMMAQKDLVAIPEDLLITLYDNKLLTKREFTRLISVVHTAIDVKKPTTKKVRKVGTVTQKQRDGKRRVVAKLAALKAAK